MKQYLKINEEVKQALSEGRPVVALESTIIAHGLSYPANLECANACEQVVRDNGAVPATIAILGGEICVGLDAAQLEYLATAKDVQKASRRDIAIALATGMDAATTVSATMLCAHLAGISVFATGGIGGVHRGAEHSFDISADLIELSNTPVAVVCAGAKSVLDLGLTLEYLETQGVPVVGYGTEEFPAFYTRSSGFKVDWRMDDCAAIARALQVRRQLLQKGGMVIANPIPAEHEMNAEELDKVIDQALFEADDTGVRGKDITPFLLGRIHKITGGESEKANIELILNNCKVAAGIAVEYSRL